MDNPPLYQQIAASIRQEILSGKIKPGSELPSIRDMSAKWSCTPGTVQRAYHQLADQGLVVSRPGQGTHVVFDGSQKNDTVLRRASLVNRAQTFLLEFMTAGYTPDEIESALRLALDQWRVLSEEKPPPLEGKLRFAGSHDLALAWISAHFQEIVPRFSLELQFTGSLGGLIALVEGKADLAGCHLWDQETGEYNLPFVSRLLPGRHIKLITLAWRRLGLIVPAENPKKVETLADLSKKDILFVNRQPGSGSRVWLDAAIHRSGLNEQNINGYQDERLTHSEVARAVAEGAADAGFGLQTAAKAFGLGFFPLVRERYDLIIPETCAHPAAIQKLSAWLLTPTAHAALAELGGYETEETGEIRAL